MKTEICPPFATNSLKTDHSVLRWLLLFCFALLIPTVQAQIPAHVWEFNGNFLNAMGGPSMVSPNGTTPGPTGYTFAAGQGPNVSNVLANFVGSTEGDDVGGSGVTALTNGNYVVRSQNWDNGAASDAGAVTWGNGSGGTIGAVSVANSLVGSTRFDRVGFSGVTALTNGNYVVRSPNWDNGAVVNAGAVTWGNGATGISGAVSPFNSQGGGIATGNPQPPQLDLLNNHFIVRWSFSQGPVRLGSLENGHFFGPTVSAITPNSGAITGGTVVTITGTNFTGATSVTIGGVAVSSFTVVNGTTITATTPVGTTGAKSVLVTTPGGTNAANTLFTYEQPSTSFPEIGLKGNGISIAQGDATPSGADHTHFGGADAASGTVVRTFTIENTGNGSLDLSGTPKVVISGSHAADFVVTIQSATTVAAGGSTTFQATFDPVATGTRTAIVSLANNDADENPSSFSIEGTGYTTSEALVANWASNFPGISGPEAAPLATPFGDGVPNILKYAFNMPLDRARSDAFNPADGPGASGLPVFSINPSGANPTITARFLRRRNSGLNYVPQRGTSLTSFVSMTGPQVVTPIDADWELVAVEDPLVLPIPRSAFSRVSVTLP
jgi:Repeat of unknown function (DUF5650)/IPT/TIG domain